MILNVRNKLYILMFLTPACLLVGLFVYSFLAWSIKVSFTDWSTIGRMGTFNGLANYREIFLNDPVFLRALKQTLILAVLFVALTIPLGVITAVLLDLGVKGQKVFRTIYLIPLSFSFVASAIMWSWMFMPNGGVINTVLQSIGMGFLAQPWLTSTNQALFSIVLVYVWQFSGFATLVYYSGIASVSETILDAAEVDGVSLVQKYVRVVLPLQKPATLTVLLLLLMYSLRVFDFVWLLTGGGPAYSSEVLANYMYRVTFNYNRFGIGAAISTFMFILSILIIILPVVISSIRKTGGQK
ncbi:sugar ABC transporter permease [Marispirochaeta sp.]|uniref:carbohydrate ABC transporter permease n=1 Tax=Marispirochaeta sp. TaxID=2038653 RepID=UPI0029C81B4A|nr:sugar ABC transporter permease [Marispirochaeta sp.]